MPAAPSRLIARALWAPVLCVAACTFDFDNTGPDVGGGGAETTSTVNSGGAGATGGGGTGADGGMGGDGRGGEGTGGVLEGCRNGELDAPEQCEDGNDVEQDGCTACTSDAARCGDDFVQRGEICDGGVECEQCEIKPESRCSTAISIATAGAYDGTTVAGLPFGDIGNDFGSDCDAAKSAPYTAAFSYTTGPFPEGVYLKVIDTVSTSHAVWAYAGCGSTPGECRVVTDFESYARSGVVPPFTTLFFGYSKVTASMTTNYHATFVPYRHLALFAKGVEDWIADEHWTWFGTTPTEGQIRTAGLAGGDPEAFVVSPSIYVGGLGDQVVVQTNYVVQGNGGVLKLYASFDDLQTEEFVLSQAAGPVVDTRFLQRPAKTEFLSLRFGFQRTLADSASGYINQVYVGGNAPP